MEAQNLAIKEQIVKTVVKSGNGGAVWVPKDWLGEEVIIILPDKPKLSIKEKIIHLLEPYLKDIMSVGIYGSYARNEQAEGSDIDVLAITEGRSLKLDFKEEGVDIISIPLDKLKIGIEKYPVIYYQIVQESEPLINASVLKELKSIKVNKENFRGYLEETKEHIKSSLELVELDKLDYPYLKSHSVLYSAMLRLRGLFIIKCVLKKDHFSNDKFKKWLISLGLSLQEFEDCCKAYTFIRDSKETKNLKISINVAEKILRILRKETEILSGCYAKQKKEA